MGQGFSLQIRPAPILWLLPMAVHASLAVAAGLVAQRLLLAGMGAVAATLAALAALFLGMSARRWVRPALGLLQVDEQGRAQWTPRGQAQAASVQAVHWLPAGTLVWIRLQPLTRAMPAQAASVDLLVVRAGCGEATWRLLMHWLSGRSRAGPGS
jgi:hypothetical protein